MKDKTVVSKEVLHATYAALQNGNTALAKELLRTGMLDGDINNPLDIERCNKTWQETVVPRVRRFRKLLGG